MFCMSFWTCRGCGLCGLGTSAFRAPVRVLSSSFEHQMCANSIQKPVPAIPKLKHAAHSHDDADHDLLTTSSVAA